MRAFFKIGRDFRLLRSTARRLLNIIEHWTLVCAFAGTDLAIAAYRHAVEERYRLSSG
jgi:hypothetical protein